MFVYLFHLIKIYVYLFSKRKTLVFCIKCWHAQKQLLKIINLILIAHLSYCCTWIHTYFKQKNSHPTTHFPFHSCHWFLVYQLFIFMWLSFYYLNSTSIDTFVNKVYLEIGYWHLNAENNFNIFHFYYLQEVVLPKNQGSLGFSIIGGTDHSCVPFGAREPGIFISHVSRQKNSSTVEC